MFRSKDGWVPRYAKEAQQLYVGLGVLNKVRASETTFLGEATDAPDTHAVTY